METDIEQQGTVHVNTLPETAPEGMTDTDQGQSQDTEGDTRGGNKYCNSQKMATPISNTPGHNSSRRQNGQYNPVLQVERRLRIGAYNTRGLRNTLGDVSQIAEGIDTLSLSETWMRPCDVEMAEIVDDAINEPLEQAHNRGFGKVAMLTNPLIEYKTVTKWQRKTYSQ